MTLTQAKAKIKDLEAQIVTKDNSIKYQVDVMDNLARKSNEKELRIKELTEKLESKIESRNYESSQCATALDMMEDFFYIFKILLGDGNDFETFTPLNRILAIRQLFNNDERLQIWLELGCIDSHEENNKDVMHG